jgi:hypothetical protein
LRTARAMLSVWGKELAVQKTNETMTPEVPQGAEAPPKPWQAEVGELLAQAAELCVEHGLDVDTFMRGAWSAYIEARPGLRDYLEEMQLRSQLEEIRKLGRMAEA